MESSFFQQVYQVVKKIPWGRVATYGQIGQMLGKSRAGRVVANALHKNPDPHLIPCHRVVDKNGRLAPGYAFGGQEEQKRLLLAEGVKFKDNNHIDLSKSSWGFKNK